jgi:hypothetical protein
MEERKIYIYIYIDGIVKMRNGINVITWYIKMGNCDKIYAIFVS